MTRPQCRLVRNAKLEAYRAEDRRPTPFSPLYDVEQLDADGTVVRLLAWGVSAEAARAAVARIDGEFIE